MRPPQTGWENGAAAGADILTRTRVPNDRVRGASGGNLDAMGSCPDTLMMYGHAQSGTLATRSQPDVVQSSSGDDLSHTSSD
jgi:hypothetical protein